MFQGLCKGIHREINAGCYYDSVVSGTVSNLLDYINDFSDILPLLRKDCYVIRSLKEYGSKVSDFSFAKFVFKV